MKISATSALVLNWTTADVWRTKAAQDYFRNLDLQEGDDLLQRFSEREHYMHTQSVSNRKYFISQCAHDFAAKHAQPQLIILGAGIAPLAVDVASRYPEAIIFDIDRHLMEEKKSLLKGQFPGIRMLTCDVTDIPALKTTLSENGWQPAQPTLVVLEGLVYYLQKQDLRNLLLFFAGNQTAVCGDFAPAFETIAPVNRQYGIDVFKKIHDAVGGPPITFYKPEAYLSLLEDCGYNNPVRVSMTTIQKERTGNSTPFEEEESAWISLVKAGGQ